jgi:hypothetical protein
MLEHHELLYAPSWGELSHGSENHSQNSSVQNEVGKVCGQRDANQVISSRGPDCFGLPVRSGVTWEVVGVPGESVTMGGRSVTEFLCLQKPHMHPEEQCQHCVCVPHGNE